MRPLAAADLLAAARALLALPPAMRQAAAVRLVREARWADRYARRHGRAHPLWGNGTLEGAARGRPRAPPQRLGERENLRCLALVLDALLEEVPALPCSCAIGSITSLQMASRHYLV